MEKRIRRIRVAPERAPRIRIPDAEQTKMENLLHSIAHYQESVATLEATIKEDMDALFLMMKTYQINDLSVVGAEAAIVTPMGRSSSHIDPEQFYRRVVEEDFFACVEVLKTRAEKVLSGKELAQITEVVPGKKGEPKLVVKRR